MKKLNLNNIFKEVDVNKNLVPKLATCLLMAGVPLGLVVLGVIWLGGVVHAVLQTPQYQAASREIGGFMGGDVVVVWEVLVVVLAVAVVVTIMAAMKKGFRVKLPVVPANNPLAIYKAVYSGVEDAFEAVWAIATQRIMVILWGLLIVGLMSGWVQSALIAPVSNGLVMVMAVVAVMAVVVVARRK